MNNTNKMRRLTILESIGSKPIVFILATVALFFVQMQFVYPIMFTLLYVAVDGFETIVQINSPTRMVFEVSASIVMAFISLFLAMLITKLFAKQIPAVFPSEEDEKAHYMKTGKWRRLYARILGAFVFIIILVIAILIGAVMRASGSGDGFALLWGMLLAIVLGFISEGLINRHMMNITRTNFYLLEEVFHGYHDGEILNSLSDDKKGFEKVVKVLKRGEAHSVSDAVRILLRRKKIQRIAVIGAIIAAATGWYLGDSLGKGVNKYIQDGTDRMLAGGGGSGSDGKGYAHYYSQYIYRFNHGNYAKMSDHNSKAADDAYNQVVRQYNNQPR